jgi:hypothetical protein
MGPTKTHIPMNRSLCLFTLRQRLMCPLRPSLGIALLAFLNGGLVSATNGVPEGDLATSRNLAFVENRGQFTDQNGFAVPHVRYMLRAPGLSVILRDHGFSYQLDAAKADGTAALNDGAPPVMDVSRVDIDFVDHNGGMVIRAKDPVPFYQNYYLSQQTRNGPEVSNSFTHVPGYQQVLYKDVYPGISIEFLLAQGDRPAFKYNIIAEPGANLAQVKFRYSGAEPRMVDGQLQLQMANGRLDEWIPKCWYGEERDHLTVKATYVAHEADVMGFGVQDGGAVPAGRNLVIDPTPVWNWGTYLNGPDYDTGYDVASWTIHGTTAIYICGSTNSTGFATAGAQQTTYGGMGDGFLAKFDGAGSLSWCTYYGGSANDIAHSVTVDASGNVFLAGFAQSTGGIAAGVGIHQGTNAGLQDAFLAKFNSSGVRQWGTYYGGTLSDNAYSVVMAGSDPIISGYTQSTTMISTAGVYQTACAGGIDAFVAKFSTTNGSLIWGTYYGGPAHETDSKVAVGPDGSIYLCGETTSTTGIATSGSYQGAGDVYLAKLNSTGTTRSWGIYYGGTALESDPEIEVDCDSHIYIVGGTASSTGIATAGAHQTVYGGSTDGFMASFLSSGTISWGTYYGGTGTDYTRGVAVLGNGRVFYGGYTASGTGTVIATASSPQPTYGGLGDGWLASFSSAGARVWGTYYGGSSVDAVYGVNTSANSLYSTGFTSSSNNISTLNTLAPTTIYSAFLGNHAAAATTDCAGGEDGLWLGDQKNPWALPNPAQDRVTFADAAWDQLSMLEFFDTQGRPTCTLRKGGPHLREVSGGVQADVEGLAPGMYTVRLVLVDGHQQSVKLLIQR